MCLSCRTLLRAGEQFVDELKRCEAIGQRGDLVWQAAAAAYG